MDGRGIVLLAGPAVVVAGMVYAVRRRRPPRVRARGDGGPGPAGVREPRRPLVPAGSGAEEIPLPE